MGVKRKQRKEKKEEEIRDAKGEAGGPAAAAEAAEAEAAAAEPAEAAEGGGGGGVEGAETAAGTKPEKKPSIYDMLNVAPTASPAEIRKAYHRLALKLHPDKNPEDKEAGEKFQELQRVYGVLSDPEKRRIYDETGDMGDADLSGDKFESLYEYFKGIFKEVTEQAIDQFEQKYRGSEEERRDLLQLYSRFKGKMNLVFEWMICSRPDDSHRFMDVINEAISDGSMKRFNPYKKWAEKVSSTPRPLDETVLKPKKRKAHVDNLAALIRGRQEQRADEMFASLEAKYGGSKKRLKREEPSEEEFAAAQERVVKGHKKSGKGIRKMT